MLHIKFREIGPFRRRRCLKLFTTDRRRLDGNTISSPCEPNGSGELKSTTKLVANAINVYLMYFQPTYSS